MAVPNIAPAPQFPEDPGNMYERKVVAAIPGERGPLRFQEGIGTDTDVPNEFTKGAMQGYLTPPGRSNHNMNVYEKLPEETMAERAHLGSAAWVEAPTYLGEFAQGSFADYADIRYEEAIRSGARYARLNPASVTD
jgi:hypothetical protein